MTDAWLSMAGAGSKGYPNGVPIDEWGIRMEQGSCNPAGASVTRGGGANGPAAVYVIRKWDEWLRQYAPQVLRHMTSISHYQHCLKVTLRSRSSGTRRLLRQWLLQNQKGTTQLTIAVLHYGEWLRVHTDRIGKRGQKLGYQDAGSWTIMKSTPEDRAKACGSRSS